MRYITLTPSWKLSQRIETSRQCLLNWCKSSNFLHSPIAQLAEHGAVNTGVVRSSRTGGVRRSGNVWIFYKSRDHHIRLAKT